jgi:putative salt-induced outer membrane protein YdiY
MKTAILIRMAAGVLIFGCAGSLALADDVPTNQWVSSVAAGFTLTSGNSDTLLATGAAATGYKGAKNELAVGIDGAYGTSKVPPATTNTVNANFIHGFAQYNRIVTDGLYNYARLEGRSDQVADLQYRITLGPGAGYYFIRNTNTDLSVEAGASHLWQQLAHVYDDYWTLRFAQRFHQVITDRARFRETIEYLPKADDFNNYIVNALVGIEADITKNKKFALQSYVTDTYNSRPAPGKKNADVMWVTGVVYKF